MPGVPSGRGCDACRKQKKKCDLSTHPCARCKRLDIPCIGLGQRRFKFMNLDEDSTQQRRGNHRHPPSSHFEPTALIISRDITNDHTHLVNAFVDKIKPSRGVKYNLAWTYGDYLLDVPAHLGINPALDKAADAVVVALDIFTSPHATTIRLLLSKYTMAVTALRQCLDDPALARSSETLAAILMLMACQGFLYSPSDRLGTHAEGAAQIIKLRGRPQTSDLFETNLLLALRGVVLFESLWNDRIVFTDQEWIELFDPNLYLRTPEGQVVQCLTRLPNMLCRAKTALASPRQADLQALQDESDSLHDELLPLLSVLRQRLEEFQEAVNPKDYPGSIDLSLRHCHLLRSYAFGLAILIFANEVRIALSKNPSKILQESHGFATEILNLAQRSSQYRPLGTSILLICLVVAELGAGDLGTRVDAYRLRLEFTRDFQGADAVAVPLEELGSFCDLNQSILFARLKK